MRKRRVKKKPLFIITLILVVIIVLVVSFMKPSNSLKKNENNDQPKQEETKKEEKKDDPYKDYKNTSNFKLENLERYIAYKQNNPSYDYEKVVTYVNIGLDKEFYSYISDADTSKGILLLMNKYKKLSSDYEPNDLEEISSEYFIYGNPYVRKMRKEAKEAFEKLSKDSIEQGYPVYGQSAYRPYSMQENLYNNAVSSLGKAQADIDTARPGHSEHQTGLTIDVSSNKSGNMLYFDDTDSFTWMNNNAHKYGFILRYKKEWEDITGFMYESWHYRYVGVDVATDMHDNYPDLTYEEYYYKFIDNK